MMNNFSPRAQQTLALARKEADRLKHKSVGTEHVLLGLIKLGQGSAVNALEKMGDLQRMRSEVEIQARSGPVPHVGNIPYTPSVKKVLALAGKESKALNDSYVGTEHILLGMLRLQTNDEQDVAGRVLRSLKIDSARAREEILSGRDVKPKEDVKSEESEGAQERTDPISRETFTIWIDPGEADVEDLKELFSAASDLHRSLGGAGLIFTRDERQRPIALCLP